MNGDRRNGLQEIEEKMNNSEKNKIANLGYVFQTQDYYMQTEEVEEDVKRIVDFTLDDKTKEMIKSRQKELQKLTKRETSKLDIGCFQACVSYPGLLVGLSNPVMSSLKQGSYEKGQDSAFKMGFSFDYVTGLPYIPGSSIKGMLRASIEKYKTDVCQWLEDDIGILTDDRLFKEMIYEIFGDGNDDVDNDKIKNNTNVLERDVFLDAIIIDGSNDKILKSDYITPHPYMFKNPIPIRILAIKPEVKLEFHFLLREKIIAKMNREQRFKLYKDLILDLGIGAKTNTGYGSLKKV
ncbi:CRISPR type III-b/ramp module ramp protein cmr6 [Eggerthia catenaformis OT 569 = DSM 20559]|uniref:CRISPR type III-b/ramp module ramp protein cmr6 n=2 Tax=Eggerthia catenaformis TaxID=31973 RepID=M2P8L8_9FIRM|nr:CRISPR type III-b/ramp module ramp protein cmr6 [Eggerthia catenaformis OT 569 = DSM 20559]